VLSIVADVGINFTLPTFTKKDILEIIRNSDKAAAAMTLAVEADYPLNRPVAINAYLDAIEEITQGEGYPSPATRQFLFEIARICDESYFHRHDSISIHRQVIAQIDSCERTIQGSETESVLKALAMKDVAKILLLEMQYEEAELMSGKASELFRKAGYQKQSFDCRFWRAQSLQNIGRDNEALSLLYSVLVYRLEHEITTSEISDVALSLHESYWNLKQDEPLGLGTLIRVAKSCVYQFYEDANCSKKRSSRIIDAVIHLAENLSVMGDFDTANSIFRVALPKTVVPNVPKITVIDEDLSEAESEVQTTTTRSYKYGLTYSDNNITGISLSEFFVP
jgi:tetratricopeptide (TPR) repeat protein